MNYFQFGPSDRNFHSINYYCSDCCKQTKNNQQIDEAPKYKYKYGASVCVCEFYLTLRCVECCCCAKTTLCSSVVSISTISSSLDTCSTVTFVNASRFDSNNELLPSDRRWLYRLLRFFLVIFRIVIVNEIKESISYNNISVFENVFFHSLFSWKFRLTIHFRCWNLTPLFHRCGCLGLGWWGQCLTSMNWIPFHWTIVIDARPTRV